MARSHYDRSNKKLSLIGRSTELILLFDAKKTVVVHGSNPLPLLELLEISACCSWISLARVGLLDLSSPENNGLPQLPNVAGTIK